MTIQEPKTDYEKSIILARNMSWAILQCRKNGILREVSQLLIRQKEYLEHARLCKERDGL
jgi:hypothetical protein